MKSQEERKEEFRGIAELAKELLAEAGDALTGESECPDCGMPIYCVRGKSMDCPHCGVHIIFQGGTPFSETEINAIMDAEYEEQRRERVKRVGRIRVVAIDMLYWLGRLLSWIPLTLARKLEKDKGQPICPRCN